MTRPPDESLCGRQEDNHMNKLPTGAGKSSFDLIDSRKLFNELDLRDDTVFLDLACGRGAYSVAASEFIGRAGAIYAFDLWGEGIEALKKQVEGIHGADIHTGIVDISRRIPLEDGSVDVCLLATVLHDLIHDGTDQGALREIKRVLRVGGRLAVVEFKKNEGPPGPPFSVRLSPDEVEQHLKPYLFRIIKTMDIGDHHYLSLLTNAGGA